MHNSRSFACAIYLQRFGRREAFCRLWWPSTVIPVTNATVTARLSPRDGQSVKIIRPPLCVLANLLHGRYICQCLPAGISQSINLHVCSSHDEWSVESHC